MSKHYLKVKIKSLAVEAQIIRTEERKVKKTYQRIKTKAIKKNEIQFEEHGNFHLTNNLDSVNYGRNRTVFWGLRNHRTIDVRNEARATQLAYAFVRGKDFRHVERNTDLSMKHFCPVATLVPRIVSMVNKYGSYNDPVTKEQIFDWIFKSLEEEKSKAA